MERFCDPVIYDSMLERFMPSREMVEHLLEKPINGALLAEIIAGSPMSLREKLAALEELANSEDVFRVYADNARQALDELYLAENEILMLNGYAYDADDGFDSERLAPYRTYEAAREGVHFEICESDENALDDLCWWGFEKWVPAVNGSMYQTYRYMMIGDEIVYFRRWRFPDEGIVSCETRFRDSAFDCSELLELPVPYVAGDIVKLDCRPFAPVRYACLFNFWDLLMARYLRYAERAMGFGMKVR